MDETQETHPEDQFEQRLKNMELFREAGIDPFGGRFETSGCIADVRELHDEKSENKVHVKAAGRITAFRIMGKSVFADIRDSSGRIQVYAKKDEVERFDLFKKLDLGDFIGVEGPLFVTRTEELTIRVCSYELLGKALRPLPEKWHGLTDLELRYRQRYLDLVVNDDSRRIFAMRSLVLREIRRYLEGKGFMEVETPMLQPIAGGAAAKPFRTHYDVLHSEMFLRIAPELYLKRLLVGGYSRVFELNRNFRNEGMSRRHNPEFTMMEIYEAFGDASTMMTLVEGLLSTLAVKVSGGTVLECGEETIDLSPPWRRVAYETLIRENAGDDWYDVPKSEKLERAVSMRLDVDDSMNEVEIAHEIYEKRIEAELVQPTFVTRFPAELVPLAKKCSDNPRYVDVFELEINGQEIAPGYSELNDPLEQRARFEQQLSRPGNEGGAEGVIDEDFLTALEHGMPPAGGMGIGIDRLVMLLSGASSIRDVILFPQLKPRNS